MPSSPKSQKTRWFYWHKTGELNQITGRMGLTQGPCKEREATFESLSEIRMNGVPRYIPQMKISLLVL
jgi:hypothetical protein